MRDAGSGERVEVDGVPEVVDAGQGGLGDVLAGPTQVTRRFTAKYDVDGAASQAWRDRLAKEAAAHGHLMLFYHGTDAYAAFVDEAPKGGYLVEPVACTPAVMPWVSRMLRMPGFAKGTGSSGFVSAPWGSVCTRRSRSRR